MRLIVFYISMMWYSVVSVGQTVIPLAGFQAVMDAYPVVDNDTIYTVTLTVNDYSNQFSGTHLIGRSNIVLWRNCKRYRVKSVETAMATYLILKVSRSGNGNLLPGVCALVEETSQTVSHLIHGITDSDKQCIDSYYRKNSSGGTGSMPDGELHNTLYYNASEVWEKTNLLKIHGANTITADNNRVEINNDNGGEKWIVGTHGAINKDTRLLANGQIQANSTMKGDPIELLARDDINSVGGAAVDADSGLFLDATGLWAGSAIFATCGRAVGSQYIQDMVFRNVGYLQYGGYKTEFITADSTVKVLKQGYYHITFNAGILEPTDPRKISVIFKLYVNGSARERSSGIASVDAGWSTSYTYDEIVNLQANDKVSMRAAVYAREVPGTQMKMQYPRFSLEWIKLNTNP